MLDPLDELRVVSLHLIQLLAGGSPEVDGSSVANSTTDGRFGAVRLKYDSNLLVFLFGGLLKFGSVLEDVYVLDFLL